MKNRPQIPAKEPVVFELEPGTYYWCSCGRSKNQPFCDGSHEGSDFSPVEFKVEKRRKMVLCLCKYTKKPPLCDGSHTDL